MVIARFCFMKHEAEKEQAKMRAVMRDNKFSAAFTKNFIMSKFDSLKTDIDKFFFLKKIDSNNEKFP